ncbi:MAG TPA: hypothetical protein VK283_09060 [Acidimicrobiales bacterium]|nr:hypothetical protein [Acidimicrobiales bacterium]
MTHILDPVVHDVEGVEPVLITLPVATGPGGAAPEPGDGARRGSAEDGGSFALLRAASGRGAGSASHD